jgi:hypothetical protein
MFIATSLVHILFKQCYEISNDEIVGLFGRRLHWSASSSIRLKGDHQYIISSSSCLTRSKTTGTWERRGEVLILSPGATGDETTNPTFKVYVPIRLNKHLYIIPEETMLDFAQEIRKKLNERPPFSAFPIKLKERDPLGAFCNSEKVDWIPQKYRAYFGAGKLENPGGLH